MTKDVLINIHGLQFEGSEADAAKNDEEFDMIETICTGEYYFRNNAHYIKYEQILDDNEVVNNMIKLRADEFCLTKKGALNTQMIFALGKKTMTEYFTPYGRIMIALDTKSIECSQEADSLSIHIAYGLEANYQYVGDCDISIEVKSNTKKE